MKSPSEHRRAKQREYARAYYARNREACLARAQAYREANRDYFNSKAATSKDAHRDAARRYYHRNKEVLLAKQRERRALKKNLVAHQAAMRRARIAKAMPAWADKKAIRAIYSNRPDGHHVDHIVPIAGRRVCGLHVDYNLQYLPAKENLSKNNRH